MDPFRTLQTVVSVWNGLKLKPLEWKHSGLMKTDVGLNMFMFFFPLHCFAIFTTMHTQSKTAIMCVKRSLIWENCRKATFMFCLVEHA